MVDQELEKAKKVRDRYLELNRDTIEKVSEYDPKMKVWRFNKIKIDENAKKFEIKKKEVKDNVSVKKRPKTEVKKQGGRPKILSNSRRERIYKDFLKGMSLEGIAAKHKVSKRQVSTDISIRRKMLGLTQVPGLTYRKLKPHFKAGKLNNTELGKMIGVNPNTVGYHRKRYNAGY